VTLLALAVAKRGSLPIALFPLHRRASKSLLHPLFRSAATGHTAVGTQSATSIAQFNAFEAIAR
jgi:hypothetical protein